MKKIVFVGDEPSKTNTFTDVAFVGSRSWTRLREWIKRINPDKYLLLNSHTEEDLKDIKYLSEKQNFKVVACGARAASRLNKLQINHFVLPHPSGLNRRLNNKRFEAGQLRRCKNWLNR